MTSTHHPSVGKTATIVFKEFTFEVRILDHKLQYGRDRYLVTPVSGSGQMWVQNIEIKK